MSGSAKNLPLLAQVVVLRFHSVTYLHTYLAGGLRPVILFNGSRRFAPVECSMFILVFYPPKDN